ncbi:hypothetical protein [Adhaeribacter aerolatus]|uniref:hypothetical protein n=1 Tax=Adhaeribacter aerolatus TaxID=670289 RepID=UPI00147837DA|nr:hypothetical protein [Adhaeribacter aerolatus]
MREKGLQVLDYFFGAFKSFFCINRNAAFTAASGVLFGGDAEFVVDADIAYNEAAGFVAEHDGDAVYGLDEVVAAYHLSTYS